jgi:hypothetical protein
MSNRRQLFLLWVLCAGTAIAEAEAPDPVEQIGRAESLYRSAPSFQATGRAVMHVIRLEAGEETRMEAVFEMRLARPFFYRIVWRDSGPDAEPAGVVWNDGEGPRCYLRARQAYTTFASDCLALSFTAGTSLGISKVLPSIFFPPGEDGNILRKLRSIESLGRERRRSVNCYRVGGTLGNGIGYQFWLATNDLGIVEFENTLGGAPDQPRETGIHLA